MKKRLERAVLLVLLTVLLTSFINQVELNNLPSMMDEESIIKHLSKIMNKGCGY